MNEHYKLIIEQQYNIFIQARRRIKSAQKRKIELVKANKR